MIDTKYSKPNKELLTHILLSVVLGKFWLWPWVYQTAYGLRKINKGYKRSPAGQLLLFVFIPFYNLYWFFKTGKSVSDCAADKKIDINISRLCVLIAIFSPVIASIILQMEICKLQDELTAIEETKQKLNQPSMEKAEAKRQEVVKTKEEKPTAKKNDIPLAAKVKEQPKPIKSNEQFEDYWICGNCERTNANVRTDCWACGYKRYEENGTDASS